MWSISKLEAQKGRLTREGLGSKNYLKKDNNQSICTKACHPLLTEMHAFSDFLLYF